MNGKHPDQELAKKAAAVRSLEFVRSDMVLGLGSGSTAAWFVELLGQRIVTEDLIITGIPTSTFTFHQAQRLNIPLTTLDKVDKIDLVVDGADEFDLAMNLIKGGGGALLQEKIVASASEHMLVITDYSKKVSCLGSFPLPVEVVKFGANATFEAIHQVLFELKYKNVTLNFRLEGEEFFVTDENHFLIDLKLGEISDLEELHTGLLSCPGVVETGLFLKLAKTIVVGQPDGTCEVIRSKVIS